GFGDHGLKAARAEFAAQLRNDAEAARMIAALGNLDVGGCFGSGEHTRRGLVVKIVRKIGYGAIPLRAGEASSSLAGTALGARTPRRSISGARAARRGQKTKREIFPPQSLGGGGPLSPPHQKFAPARRPPPRRQLREFFSGSPGDIALPGTPPQLTFSPCRW